MLKIRLSRRGKKRQPSYRVVVTDAKFKRDGRYVEKIGFYNPLTDPETVVIDESRALYWLSVGAQPTDPVRRFLNTRGTYDRLKRVHAGEEIEALTAEYEGRPVAEESEDSVIETVEDTAVAAAEVVEEAVEEAVEAVEEAVAEVAEAAEEIFESDDEADESAEEADEASDESAADEEEKAEA